MMLRRIRLALPTAALLLATTAVGVKAENYAISTFAGTRNASGNVDGTAATFNNPFGLAIDSAKNLYVADTLNNTIRKITPAGVVSTLAGSAGLIGSTDATGSAARFNYPVSVAVDSSGNVYVADAKNSTIRRITPAGVVSTLAGAPFQFGAVDGPAASARFFLPYGVAVDAAGNVYVADGGNHTIRRISAAGVVSTVAGTAGQSGLADGSGGAARFQTPWGLAVDAAGNLYVADSENNAIRRVTPAGAVSTIAGASRQSGAVDGATAQARFNRPRGLAVDAAGNIFVADADNSVVRRISTGGTVSTLAGSAELVGDVDSVGPAARFYYTTGVVVDGATIYVADTSNNLIRKGVPASQAALPVISVQPLDQEVSAGQSVPFRVVASGTSLTYQWLKNSVAIPGATAATYTIASAQADDVGVYSVRIAGAGGSIDSGVGTLSVTPVGTGPIVITARPLSQNASVGASVTFSVTATGTGLTYQWSKDGAVIPGATGASYAIASAQPGNAGTYAVRLTAGTASETASAKLVVGSSGGGTGLSITGQPASQTVNAGQSAAFSVTASGTGVTYQWFKNGVAVAGGNAASLVIPNAQPGDAGTYFARVSGGGATLDSASATLTVNAVQTGPTARLSNLSVRTAMAAGQILTVGVIVDGGPRNVLVRAAGPSLAAFGLAGAMTDPRLELYNDASQLVFQNDDWPANLANTFASVGAFPFPNGSRDAAFVQSIDGARSIQARGTAAGVVLVEAYDIGTGNSPRLINVSARNRVGTGDDILIAGFIVEGTGEKRLLIRAVGPKLAAFGVTGVLANPKLEVFSDATKLTENDDWSSALAPTFAAVGAFALDAGSRDAALLTSLQPGSYTVQVRGADGGTGEALVEIYEVP